MQRNCFAVQSATTVGAGAGGSETLREAQGRPPKVACGVFIWETEAGGDPPKRIVYIIHMSKRISGGVAHQLPADLRKALGGDPKAVMAWEDLTPLSRNEWICWLYP